MRVLLDTHAFLWAASDDSRMSQGAKKIFLDSDNELLLSLVSVWEMAIKASIGKLVLRIPLRQLLEEQCRINDIGLLPIAFDHVLAVETMPFHHRDPFDRLLAAQALGEHLTLLSRDPLFDVYGVSRQW